MIKADSRLLRSALVNLVSNAIKFSREGSNIELGARRDDGQVIIDVADGCGGLPPGKAEELLRSLSGTRIAAATAWAGHRAPGCRRGARRRHHQAPRCSGTAASSASFSRVRVRSHDLQMAKYSEP